MALKMPEFMTIEDRERALQQFADARGISYEEMVTWWEKISQQEELSEENKGWLEALRCMAEESSPVIELPQDEELRKRLNKKLEEYHSRISSQQPPAVIMDSICKIAVLGRLLQDGRVVTWEMSRELGRNYGQGFDPIVFINACGVIESYCKTGGAGLISGTGLPKA